MGNIAISVESLGKCYRIGHAVTRPDNFCATVRSVLGAPFHYLRTRLREPEPNELIWALKHVSFEVKHGEVLGIIGLNGAGKSTLLKILSRITEPTEGEARVHGKVGSLLEVGTGFHHELTGRENIYLNGAILGMRKAEVDRKFDEIVDFSGVGKFLDTPVKRYSSGMYVRLAFAVAAHLEPKILLIDEVLAVGDIGFQKKCLGKMKEVGREGRTVLLVSHNMETMMRLCKRAILLNAGCIEQDGPTTEVVKAYLMVDSGLASYQEWQTPQTAPGDEVVRLKSVKACTESGEIQETFDIRYPIFLEFEYWVLQEHSFLIPSFWLLNETDTIVFISSENNDSEEGPYCSGSGVYKSRCQIPGNFLAEGTFKIHAYIVTPRDTASPLIHFREDNVITFHVHDTLEGGSARGRHRGAYYGVVRPILEWETTRIAPGP